MTDWKELYQQKLIPVEDIAKVIPPHSHCSLSDGAADPRAITREIEKRYAEFTDVSFMQGLRANASRCSTPAWKATSAMSRSLAPLDSTRIIGKAYMQASRIICHHIFPASNA